MDPKKEKRGISYPAVNMIIAAAALILIGAASALFLFVPGGIADTAGIVWADSLFVLVLLIAAMATALRAGVRKTLYLYSNVALVGGILFCFLLFLDMTAAFSGSLDGGVLDARLVFAVITGFPKRFSTFAVPVMSAVFIALLLSNIALIRHEGFRPKNLLSVIVGGFYIGGTAAIYFAAYLLEKSLAPSSLPRLASVLNTYIPMFFVLMMCYFECILVGCAVMGYAATRKKPEYDKDFIIILGCSIDKKGGLLPLLKGRANRAVRFAWDQEIASGKRCRFVPSGGQGPDEVMSEGSAMELYLLSHGAESDEVFPEKQSENTYQNMLYSKKIIDSIDPDAKIAFATTNFHVFRSGMIARQAGVEAEGVAAKTKWYFWPNGFIREFFGILSIHRGAHIAAAVICAAVCASLGAAAYFVGI